MNLSELFKPHIKKVRDALDAFEKHINEQPPTAVAEADCAAEEADYNAKDATWQSADAIATAAATIALTALTLKMMAWITWQNCLMGMFRSKSS